MRRQLAGWERKATPVSLLMLDIDHFTRFNDLHGHQTGDAVISEVAMVLSKQLREMYTAYRYGGEEFAILLPSTRTQDSGIVAERIRNAIEQTAITRDNKILKVTISLGIAVVISGDRAVEIIRRADEAL
jgi:diguanylate cyclase (GGDEF)-like protein